MRASITSCGFSFLFEEIGKEDYEAKLGVYLHPIGEKTGACKRQCTGRLSSSWRDDIDCGIFFIYHSLVSRYICTSLFPFLVMLFLLYLHSVR